MRSGGTQLLDVERTAKRRGTTKALVVIDRRICPACGTPTEERAMWEPALFFFGGYGATRRSTMVICPDRWCRWTLTAEVTEVRPERGGSR